MFKAFKNWPKLTLFPNTSSLRELMRLQSSVRLCQAPLPGPFARPLCQPPEGSSSRPLVQCKLCLESKSSHISPPPGNIHRSPKTHEIISSFMPIECSLFFHLHDTQATLSIAVTLCVLPENLGSWTMRDTFYFSFSIHQHQA